MAITVTIGGFSVHGNQRHTWGTFTTAAGDTSLDITTGLNWISDYEVSLSPGGVGTQTPKLSASGGVITAVWDDTQGLSGKYAATGR